LEAAARLAVGCWGFLKVNEKFRCELFERFVLGKMQDYFKNKFRRNQLRIMRFVGSNLKISKKNFVHAFPFCFSNQFFLKKSLGQQELIIFSP
jgi:hypothetical protein